MTHSTAKCPSANVNINTDTNFLRTKIIIMNINNKHYDKSYAIPYAKHTAIV